MHLADLALHLRVDDTGSNGDCGYVGLFDREREGEVVQDGFSGAVAAPALVGGCCGARGGKDYAAVGGGGAEEGERGLDLGGWEVRGGFWMRLGRKGLEKNGDRRTTKLTTTTQGRVNRRVKRTRDSPTQLH